MDQKHTRALALLGLTAAAACGSAPTFSADRLPGWESQDSTSGASLRGVCAVSGEVAWASGSGGTLLRTLDGGATWQSIPAPGPGGIDFRDVHALDAQRAWVMVAGTPATVFYTPDGGATWQSQHHDPRDAAFFDSLAFWDEQAGLLFGDPVDGGMTVLRTTDGSTWRQLEGLPVPVEGEAGFAASGTCVAVVGERHAWIGTGGERARVLHTRDGGNTWRAQATPMRHGLPSTGIFSVGFVSETRGVVVGGDYRDENETQGNAAWTVDGGASWHPPLVPPRGYRSCVAWVPGAHATVVACGPTGTDLSRDGGRTWHPLGNVGYHAVAFTPSGDAGWAVGSDGRVARWVW